MVVTSNREPDVFGAASHPARRHMLDLLVEADRPVNMIAVRFKMNRFAVFQQLRVLLDAGLVTEQRHGLERRYRLVSERLNPCGTGSRIMSGPGTTACSVFRCS